MISLSPMAVRFYFTFFYLLFCLVGRGQSDKIEIKPRYLKQALLNLDSIKGVPFLNPWDYQSHSAGFGKPGQNALPYVIKQAYRHCRFIAIPEPYQFGVSSSYPPNLPDGEWGVFSENGKGIGAQFQVLNNQFDGQYEAHFSGAVLRFFITPFFIDSTLVNDFENYVIQGQFEEGIKTGKWVLKSEKSKVLSWWNYDSTGKYQTQDSILEKKHELGLIRYQYYSEDHQSIIQGFAKKIYFTFKITKGGKLLNRGEYISFHSNETIAVKGFYNEGLKHGSWKYWNEKGEIVLIEKWRNGKETYSK